MGKISASQTAELLGVSVDDVRILEEKGLLGSGSPEEIARIKAKRGMTIAEAAGLVDAEIQQKTVSSISLFQKILRAVGGFLAGYFVLTAIAGILFIAYPLPTSDFFGYYYRYNTEGSGKVLAAATGPVAVPYRTSVLADVLKPAMTVSLVAVKAVDRQKYVDIVTPPAPTVVAGPQGPAGPQGLQGPQGPAGLDGTNGTNGKDGVDGISAWKDFTDVDTLASVTERGASTSAALILNGGITTSTTNDLKLDSGTTGAISIGIGPNAKIITLGNTIGATTLNLNAGSGGIILEGVASQTNGKRVLCIDNVSHQLFIGNSQNNCNSSSEQDKHNISDISLGLDAVNALRPVSFNYNSDNEPSLGFIAQEVQSVDERFVVRNQNGGIQAIDSSQFIPVLTRAIQQLSVLVGDLSSKIYTRQICLKKSDGGEVCLNGDQLETVLIRLRI